MVLAKNESIPIIKLKFLDRDYSQIEAAPERTRIIIQLLAVGINCVVKVFKGVE